MANLNLSQFTEKTFVEDADWTFVWDTAGLISKKVSRNNWLNSGTITTSAPVTISQTWNAGGVAFTALKVNAVSTTSASGSLLLDLQVGGASVFKVSKAGEVTSGFISTFGVNALNLQYGATGSINAFTNFNLGTSNSLVFSDVFLQRDGAANTLALRNGINPQTFRVYNTYSNAGADYERASFSWASNVFKISTEKLGGGGDRGMEINVGLYLNINVGGSGVMGLSSSAVVSGKNLTFLTDNTYDIGASGANRPRNVYAGSSIQCGTSSFLGWAGRAKIYSPSGSNNVIQLLNNAENDFNLLILGLATDAFPAIARDGAGIKITGAAAGSTSWVKVPPVAVASLPAAATAGAGARAFVNDATSPVFGSAVTGGGSVPVPVYSTGSAWNVG